MASTGMQTSLLLAESIRAFPVADTTDGFWSLLPDPVQKHIIHLTNFRHGASYLINCCWLERIQEDISNEVSSDDNSSFDSKTRVDMLPNESEGSLGIGDPILDNPSKCVPVFILPSNTPDMRPGGVSNESKHGSYRDSSSSEALIGMNILCDALLGHVVLFRTVSGLATAINLTVHLRLSQLQESLSRSRENSERLPIKEELCRAMSAEQIRWRHSSECIRRVEEGLKGMPLFGTGTAFSLTPQVSTSYCKLA